MTAKEVMDESAALLNDQAKAIFTYAVQIPYLNIALSELREIMEQNNVPASNAVDDSITLTAGLTGIGGPSSNPALPPRLIEPQTLYERPAETDLQFVEMKQVEFLPNLTPVLTAYLQFWCWQEQMIKFLGATGDVEVRIRYVADAVGKVTTETDIITIINSKNFLAFRTAGLCAQHIGENEARANMLNGNAQTSIDRFLSISTKSRQATATRRRPFNASYRSRGGSGTMW